MAQSGRSSVFENCSSSPGSFQNQGPPNWDPSAKTPYKRRPICWIQPPAINSRIIHIQFIYIISIDIIYIFTYVCLCVYIYNIDKAFCIAPLNTVNGRGAVRGRQLHPSYACLVCETPCIEHGQNCNPCLGGCQNDGPFLGPQYNTAPSIKGTQKGAIILTTARLSSDMPK